MEIIAEIGSAHQGKIHEAKRLIEGAAEAGADTVKTQVIFAREILPRNAGKMTLAGGEVDLYKRFEALERPLSFYQELQTHATRCGLGFLASPFGLESARLLRDMGVNRIKIASPELNHYPLLEEVVAYHIPIILSTGISLLGDIERALAAIPGDVSLLHCVTAYPAPETEYNLSLIPTLSCLFGIPVGVSDHTAHPLFVPLLALSQGACALEKHLTLSRRSDNLDDSVSLTVSTFKEMVATLASYRILSPEAMREDLTSRWGASRIKALLGDGIKRLPPSESSHYAATNRTIHTLGTILPGDVFSNRNIALLRSGQTLTPGLAPEWWGLLLGRRALCPLAEGEGVTLDALFPPSSL